MTADDRRIKAIKAYCKAYREYQQLDSVREHICVEMSGDTLIEIHRFYGERKGERVLRVNQKEEGMEVSAEVIAYERATDQLLSMIKSRRKRLEENEQRRQEARRWA